MQVISDQSNFAGIGNYLRSEIMYAAKINPFKISGNLTDDELKIIKNKLFSLPRRVYDKNGSSEYTNLGEFQFKVYKQKFDPYGNPVYKKKIGAQYVYYCRTHG